MKPRIMMVSSEASPFAKTGGLADVLEALPAALATLGHPVAVVIPRYMAARAADAECVWQSLEVRLGRSIRKPSVWKLVLPPDAAPNLSLFFLDDIVYDRNGIYGDAHGEFGDNHIRFAMLSRGAMEIARRIFPVDIFHCHDWQAALLPLFLHNRRVVDPHFSRVRSVLTIHNLGYQGIFDRKVLADAGIPPNLFNPGGVEFWGKVNFLKGGILTADALTTVSRRYADEIQTAEYGCRLEGVIRSRRERLTGILNGIDFGRWDPATDPLIPAHYSAENLAGKRVCKLELVRAMGLPEVAMERPLIGVVSRFAGQKGFELLAEAGEAFFSGEVSLVALGNGEKRIEDIFRHLQWRFPGKVAVRYGYDDALAHRIEAGADMFLMPSRYEPCGLNQMYSLRYGTPPVVRATGGLDDTVIEAGPEESTGFKFHAYNGNALREALERACRLWRDREAWTATMVRGMRKDFSWTASAAEYSRLYSALLNQA